MMSARNTHQPIKRLATGLRMATVIVVLGTLVAVWHPGTRGPAATVSDDVSTSAPPAASSTSSTDSTYFPSRFPAPQNVEPQAPTF
jgi:hypothetical protein